MGELGGVVLATTLLATCARRVLRTATTGRGHLEANAVTLAAPAETDEGGQLTETLFGAAFTCSHDFCSFVEERV